MPGRDLGFLHPKGEIHINGSNTAFACPGDDDATDPQCTIMVVKRGSASGLTVGRLNTLRSFTRVPAAGHGDHDWQTSKTVTILPRSSKWPRENPFAQPGNSGAAVGAAPRRDFRRAVPRRARGAR